MMMNKTLLGVAFTDRSYINVGASAFKIDHDYITRQELVIRTASGGGGTLLTEGVDYTLGGENMRLSAEVSAAMGSGHNAMSTITVTNVTYQTGTLYVSGLFLADDLDATEIPTHGVRTESAGRTLLAWENWRRYRGTTGASNMTHYLPSGGAETGKRFRFEKADTGAGKWIINGNGKKIGADDVATTYELLRQGDWVELEYDGTRYLTVSMTNLFGTYTPTLYETTNISASTSYSNRWMRIGKMVIVAGRVDIDPTDPSAVTLLGMSLPISSAIGNSYELSGAAFCSSAYGYGIAVLGDTFNDRASFSFISDASGNNVAFRFTFMYEII